MMMATMIWNSETPMTIFVRITIMRMLMEIL